MKEEDFKKQYADGLDGIHAPAELIAQTKERVAGERERYDHTRKRKRLLMYLPAAAALLFISVSVFWGMGGREMRSQNEAGIYMGNLEADTASGEEEEVGISRTSVLPMEFGKETAWTEEMEGKQVWFAVTSRGTYLAAWEEEGDYVIVKSGTTDKDAFWKQIKQVLLQ